MNFHLVLLMVFQLFIVVFKKNHPRSCANLGLCLVSDFDKHSYHLIKNLWFVKLCFQRYRIEFTPSFSDLVLKRCACYVAVVM